MNPAEHAPHSYRHDRTVPPFDDTRVVLVMDGDCALCSAAARRFCRWDQSDRLRIATVQSPLGRALLNHYGLSADDPESWLAIEDGHARGGLDAVLRVSGTLRPWMRIFTPVRLLPRRWKDWLYARIARNRYALFGRTDICALPDAAVQRRLLR